MAPHRIPVYRERVEVEEVGAQKRVVRVVRGVCEHALSRRAVADCEEVGDRAGYNLQRHQTQTG